VIGRTSGHEDISEITLTINDKNIYTPFAVEMWPTFEMVKFSRSEMRT